MDIDRFKGINDAHGHQVGDEVMRQTANLIVRQLREMDYAFRYGGEEFAVILPATDSISAVVVAERIRGALEQAPLARKSGLLHMTISVGGTSATSGDDVPRIIQRADQALYAAKHSGRNCVRYHDGKQVVAGSGIDLVPQVIPTALPETHPLVANASTALHGELTRQICHSRRMNHPLSLVGVRIDTTLASTENSRIDPLGDAFRAVIAVAQEKLPANCFAAPLDKAEFVIMLPGYQQVAARQWAQTHLAIDMIAALLNGHDVEVRWEACELRPLETAEQLLNRTREHFLAATVVVD